MNFQWELVHRLLPRLEDLWVPDIDELYEFGLVNSEECKLLRSLSRSQQRRMVLFAFLPRKGKGAFETFLAVLERNDKSKVIAKMLWEKASWGAYPYLKKPEYRSKIDWELFVQPLLQELADAWTPDLDELCTVLRLDKNDLPDSLFRNELCKTLLIDILPQRGRVTYGTFLAMLPRSKEMEFIIQVLKDWEESFLTCEFRFLRVDRRWGHVVQVLLPDLVKIWRPHYLQRLYDLHILSKEEYDTLLGFPHFEQCKKLLIQILPYRRPGSYDLFLNVLLETEEEDSVVVNMLRKREEERRYGAKLGERALGCKNSW